MSDDPIPLVERLRDRLCAEPTLREVKMFGGLAFMVNERMVLATRPGGDLLLRIDPSERAELLSRPGAEPADMAGRSMGDNWMVVAVEALDGDDVLHEWIGVALAFNHRKAGSGR